MAQTAKLFMNGRSQAVRLPSEFRFEGDEVSIRRDPATGDVVLSHKTGDWNAFFKLRDELSKEERAVLQIPRKRTPLKPRKIF
jgi:antitoxin VapB